MTVLADDVQEVLPVSDGEDGNAGGESNNLLFPLGSDGLLAVALLVFDGALRGNDESAAVKVRP